MKGVTQWGGSYSEGVTHTYLLSDHNLLVKVSPTRSDIHRSSESSPLSRAVDIPVSKE